jgi:hypothetical protein
MVVPDVIKPVSVEVTAPSTVMLGEPIRLLCRFVNHRNKPVVFPLFGDPMQGWYRLELRDADDRIVAQERQRFPSSIRLPDTHPTKAGGVRTVELVVPHLLLPKVTGAFTVRVVIDLEYSILRGPNPASSGTAYHEKATIRVPLQVRDADATALQKLAEDLGKQVLSEKRDIKAMLPSASLSALFSLPDTVALPTWQTVLDALKTDPDRTGYICGLLHSVTTRSSVDLLIGLRGRFETAPEEKPTRIQIAAGNALCYLYQEMTDESQKAYLRQRYVAIGGSKDDLHNGPPEEPHFYD